MPFNLCDEGEIIVDGGDGNDLLDIDHSVADVVSYNGELGDDSLALQGTPVNSISPTYTRTKLVANFITDGHHDKQRKKALKAFGAAFDEVRAVRAVRQIPARDARPIDDLTSIMNQP